MCEIVLYCNKCAKLFVICWVLYERCIYGADVIYVSFLRRHAWTIYHFYVSYHIFLTIFFYFVDTECENEYEKKLKKIY